MDKILSTEQAIEVSNKLHKHQKSIALAGGCFDILHIGHITFLENAKRAGDVLLILLESDEAIQRTKGKNRPINKQQDRAKILAALSVVDYVILLPPDMKNKNYDELVIRIKPAIIATTEGDLYKFHKERQAKLINAAILTVTVPITNQSTTKIINILEEL